MKWLFALILCPVTVFSFVLDPWYTKIGEFQLRSSYAYRYYPTVNQGKNPSSYHSHDQLIDLNLGVQFWPGWDFQIASDFSHTRRLNWGTQRFGLQLRYLLLDDVAGDLVSLSLGLQSYFVPTRNMRDVSSPYHAQGNIELGASVGKEIDRTFNWLYRFWGFFGFGFANRGSPWIRPLLAAEMNFHQRHKFKAFTEGYFGFGHRHRVNIRQFNGYGKIAHRSIDLGLNYTYLFKIWGSLGFQYTYRLYAHSFPQHASTFKVEYRLPFSLF